MPQHYSDDRAVASKRSPEYKNMTPIFLPDCPPEGGRVNTLRAAGLNSDIRCYRAIPDGNGDFLRDKAGNPILGKLIKTQCELTNMQEYMRHG